MITDHDIKGMDTNGIMWEYFNITPDGKSAMTVMGMVKEFSKVLDQKIDTALYTQLVIEEFDEWLAEGTCVEDDLKELADLVYVVYGYANACGYDLDEAIRRVHANNLGRCVQPDGSILRREDGKIIKNKAYPKVDLSDLIGNGAT
jgi:NTP pyrophosphatase (non-canonical NTP hydrolase)